MTKDTVELLKNLLANKSANEFSESIVSFLRKIGKRHTDLPKQIAQLTHTDFIIYLETINELDHYYDYLLSNGKSHHSEFKKTDFPFSNREKEIEKILSYLDVRLQTRYLAISAPPGYGKSHLLSKLAQLFNERGSWDFAKIITKQHMSKKKLVDEIAKELKLPTKHIDYKNAGIALSGAWIKKTSPKFPKGLILLIDFQTIVKNEISGFLVEDLIPQIEENLQTLQQYNDGKLVFRVVLTGRHLHSIPSIKSKFHLINLSAFDLEAIRETIQNSVPDLDERGRDDLASHILFFTGGHPDCIAEFLIDFINNRMPIDVFAKKLSQKNFRTTILKYSNQVAKLFPRFPNVNAGIVENLHFFRFIDYQAIIAVRDLYTNKKSARGTDDFVVISNQLMDNGIYVNDKDETHYLVDDVARRLLVIRLSVLKRAKLSLYTRRAKYTCKKLILESDRDPERWFVEYMYQEIQQYKFEPNQEKRSLGRKKFFSTFLPEALKLYLNQTTTKKEKILRARRLLEEIDYSRHWEFRFLINYHMRKDQFSEEPFLALKRQLQENIGR